MLAFKNLSLRRGTRALLQGVDITLHRGMKTGLTGRNGVGKSSLFEIILGNLAPDSGDFDMPKNLVIAHVAQEVHATEVRALDYVLEGDTQLSELQARIAAAEANDSHSLLGELYDQMNSIDGYTAPARAASMLQGLGFDTEAIQRPVKTFSGGWRVRLNLARALMCRSDVLLLDEPTNHLDLEAVLWLESWLKSYSGTLLLISHDSIFLDNIVTHIMNIEQQKITLYTGNYTAFEQARATQLSQNTALYNKQQKDVQRIRQFAARFGAKATKSRQAQSRLKALQRMELVSLAHADVGIRFEFYPPSGVSNPLIQFDQLDVGYSQVPVIRSAKATVANGDRIAILGGNGQGKSTLIKFIAGELAPMSGDIMRAPGLRVGYFAQHQLEQLDMDASPMTHLQRLDRRASEQSLRNFLGGFGFEGDQALDLIGPLSGGEKSRLALAMIVFQKPDLLLLDEPTNHLDMDTRIALNDALQAYEGAVILVSHDRQLISSVADTLWYVSQGKLSTYDGDIDGYIEYVRQSQISPVESVAGEDTAGGNRKQQRQMQAERRKRLQPLKREVDRLEKQMNDIQQRLSSLETQLGESSVYEAENKPQLTLILQEQTELKRMQQDVEEQWLEKIAELEQSP